LKSAAGGTVWETPTHLASRTSGIGMNRYVTVNHNDVDDDFISCSTDDSGF
jgi:Tfp pilus assembly protein PilZ